MLASDRPCSRVHLRGGTNRLETTEFSSRLLRLSSSDLALELERLRRQLGVLRLGQERVEPAAMVDGLKALAETRNLTERPSASEISVTLRRLGRNRRLVLMLEWLTLWPTWGPLPVNSQRRDMAIPLNLE